MTTASTEWMFCCRTFEEKIYKCSINLSKNTKNEKISFEISAKKTVCLLIWVQMRLVSSDQSVWYKVM